MREFIPDKILYEPAALTYPLGKELAERYTDMRLPLEQIRSHNQIEAMRSQPNAHFAKMKRCLVIGVRKTHIYRPNFKVSDFLVPYTSSGCPAMCLYCYLVCHYNKCAYLRLFVNREQMLEKLIRKAASYSEQKVFEIGSNSDLVLENTITNNLVFTIQEFCAQPKGVLTFPTKFDMVAPLLPLEHKGRVIARVSLNPDSIIWHTEFGTCRLAQRIEAINQLCEAGYPVGILIAPVIFVDGWEGLYAELIEQIADMLSEKAKRTVFFEVIFMTYSYVHDQINQAAFPGAMQIYRKEDMTVRGRGKYRYKDELKKKGEAFFRIRLTKAFPGTKIVYIV